MRRTPLARVSKKRKDLQDLYQRAVQTVMLRDKGCVIADGWPEVRCSGRLDPHHVAPTGRFPELRCEPSNIITACRAHHDAAHAYPELARMRGYLR